jgi:hypothetical protein
MGEVAVSPRAVQLVRVVASGQVYGHPCLVWLLRAEGLSSTARYARFYDGFSASDRLMFELSGRQGSSDVVAPARPLPFLSGVYVVLESDKVAGEVAFVPLPEA